MCSDMDCIVPVRLMFDQWARDTLRGTVVLNCHISPLIWLSISLSPSTKQKHDKLFLLSHENHHYDFKCTYITTVNIKYFNIPTVFSYANDGTIIDILTPFTAKLFQFSTSTGQNLNTHLSYLMAPWYIDFGQILNTQKQNHSNCPQKSLKNTTYLTSIG